MSVRLAGEGEFVEVLDTNIQIVFRGFLELALLSGSALYAGLVLSDYRIKGPRARPPINWHDPAHSIEHVGVWLGVKGLDLAVRATGTIFGMLSEASAEVGEWFLDHRHHPAP